MEVLEDENETPLRVPREVRIGSRVVAVRTGPPVPGAVDGFLPPALEGLLYPRTSLGSPVSGKELVPLVVPDPNHRRLGGVIGQFSPESVLASGTVGFRRGDGEVRIGNS